MKTPERETGN
jgi:hypothetical protein